MGLGHIQPIAAGRSPLIPSYQDSLLGSHGSWTRSQAGPRAWRDVPPLWALMPHAHGPLFPVTSLAACNFLGYRAFHLWPVNTRQIHEWRKK